MVVKANVGTGYILIILPTTAFIQDRGNELNERTNQ